MMEGNHLSQRMAVSQIVNPTQEAWASASRNGHPEMLLDQGHPGQSECPIKFFLHIAQ